MTRHKSAPSRVYLMAFGAIFLFATNTSLQTAPPLWWQRSGAVPAGIDPNDFAALNHGQLKSLVHSAMLEMDAAIPVRGAGAAIHSLVDGWLSMSALNQGNDFAAVNVGQLKTVGKLFYDRLDDLNSPLQPPWTTPQSSDHDYAIATIGQAKTVFAFDLDHDSDGDFMSDFKEGLAGVNADGSARNSDDDEIPDYLDSDSDNDGVDDDVENSTGSDPTDPDTDNDGVNDYDDAAPLDANQFLAKRHYATVEFGNALAQQGPTLWRPTTIGLSRGGSISVGYEVGNDQLAVAVLRKAENSDIYEIVYDFFPKRHTDLSRSVLPYEFKIAFVTGDGKVAATSQYEDPFTHEIIPYSYFVRQFQQILPIQYELDGELLGMTHTGRIFGYRDKSFIDSWEQPDDPNSDHPGFSIPRDGYSAGGQVVAGLWYDDRDHDWRSFRALFPGSDFNSVVKLFPTEEGFVSAVNGAIAVGGWTGMFDQPLNPHTTVLSHELKPFLYKGGSIKDFYSVIPESMRERVKISPYGFSEISSNGDFLFSASVLNGDGTWRNASLLREGDGAGGKLIELKGLSAAAAYGNGFHTADLVALGEETLVMPLEMRITNRDDLTKRWVDNRLKNDVVYSGTSTGDMVSWKLCVPDSLATATFSWRAEGPSTITGPTGIGLNEWKIADGDDEIVDKWLKWKPGKYTIRCEIGLAGAGSSAISFTQDVGWRSDDLLVIGQIIPTSTHIGDAPSGNSESAQYKRAAWNDVGWGGLVGYILSRDVPASIATQKVFQYWGEEKAHGDTPKGPFSTSFPDNDGAVLEKHRYWAVNYMLNLAPDFPTIGESITSQSLKDVVKNKQFRILHQHQMKYLLDSEGAIDFDSTVTIKNEANKGLTKIVGGILAEWNAAKELLQLGQTANFGFALQVRTEEPEASPWNRAQIISNDRMRFSSFASARIAEKGRNVNWRLFGKDAPWIFSEIIHEVRADRTATVTHKLSVDAKFKEEQKSGDTPFNNLNIYKREVLFRIDGSISDNFERDALFPMEGELKPFIDSTSGQWPEPPIQPSLAP